jgi:hypothetical protein
MTLATPVVRGMLSRTSRGPWSIHQGPGDPLDEVAPVSAPYVTILDGDEVEIAHVILRGDTGSGPGHAGEVPRYHYENPSLIAAAPDLAADLLAARAAALEVNQALRAAGQEEGGAAGVRSLEELRTRAEREASLMEESARLAGVEAAGHVDKIRELTAQLGDLRTLLATFRDRELEGAGAELYRELVGALMTARPRPTGPTGQEPARSPMPEPRTLDDVFRPDVIG